MIKPKPNDNFNVEEFWARVKELCKKQNISQKRLSLLIGVSDKGIYRQIVANVAPNSRDAVNMAYALNVSVEYLLTGNKFNPLITEMKELRTCIDDVNAISSPTDISQQN